MTEERPERRPPDPDDVHPRLVAEGAARVIEREYPPEGHGLGPVGEDLVRRSIRADHENEPEKHLALFTAEWRGLIARGNRDPQVITALNAVIDQQIRRFARSRALKASWKWAVVAGPLAYAAMNYSTEAAKWITEHIPLLRAIIKLILDNGS